MEHDGPAGIDTADPSENTYLSKMMHPLYRWDTTLAEANLNHHQNEL